MRRCVLGLIVWLVAAAAAADPVDDYVPRAQLRNLHIPGLSLAVIRDGRIVKAQGYGPANLELDVPATSRTVYEIGSNTKQFPPPP